MVKCSDEEVLDIVRDVSERKQAQTGFRAGGRKGTDAGLEPLRPECVTSVAGWQNRWYNRSRRGSQADPRMRTSDNNISDG